LRPVLCHSSYYNQASYFSINTAQIFYSAGSDSRILVWEDVTIKEEEERLTRLEQDMITEQQMNNDLRNKRYAKVWK
jgi:hypothetical protein